MLRPSPNHGTLVRSNGDDDDCIVYIDIAKFQMRFLHYAFFLAKSHVSVQCSWPFCGRTE